jgi:hypothetical protein
MLITKTEDGIPTQKTLFGLVVSIHGHSVAVAAKFAVGAWADGPFWDKSVLAQKSDNKQDQAHLLLPPCAPLTALLSLRASSCLALNDS